MPDGFDPPNSMDRAIIYIHGKGGTADEATHYKPLFNHCDVIGFDYSSQTPWEAKEEFPIFFDNIGHKYRTTEIIANSIGAFFAMNALSGRKISRAYFISPIVDMAKLISDMMARANVTDDELQNKREIPTTFGETLSWNYLCYVRNHPIKWNIPTYILYGDRDNLTSYKTIVDFANRTNAVLTVMNNGEHWFHTNEQMKFLDDWIRGAM